MAAKNGEKTEVTLVDVVRELRALGQGLGGEIAGLRADQTKHHQELLAAIAKTHGLESRVSRLEADMAKLKRRTRSS